MKSPLQKTLLVSSIALLTACGGGGGGGSSAPMTSAAMDNAAPINGGLFDQAIEEITTQFGDNSLFEGAKDKIQSLGEELGGSDFDDIISKLSLDSCWQSVLSAFVTGDDTTSINIQFDFGQLFDTVLPPVEHANETYRYRFIQTGNDKQIEAYNVNTNIRVASLQFKTSDLASAKLVKYDPSIPVFYSLIATSKTLSQDEHGLTVTRSNTAGEHFFHDEKTLKNLFQAALAGYMKDFSIHNTLALAADPSSAGRGLGEASCIPVKSSITAQPAPRCHPIAKGPEISSKQCLALIQNKLNGTNDEFTIEGKAVVADIDISKASGVIEAPLTSPATEKGKKLHVAFFTPNSDNQANSMSTGSWLGLFYQDAQGNEEFFYKFDPNRLGGGGTLCLSPASSTTSDQNAIDVYIGQDNMSTSGLFDMKEQLKNSVKAFKQGMLNNDIAPYLSCRFIDEQ